MKRALSLVASLALLGLTACAGAKISTDFDKAADFSHFKTYSWIKGMSAADPLVEERIKSAVDRKLAAKGLTQVESSADLHVATYASTSVQQEVNTASYGYGYSGTGWDNSMVSVSAVDVGTLVLDLVDPSSQKLVWRGTATGVVGYSVQQEKVDRIVERMLTRFPLKG
ncbi:MAG TPA: DUF4136 domain-containing protein [Thermoanaerobaculia bacterium]|nr:DUF4136 domain-containing protein [Thermoanaerobaculia bacterium]